MMGFKELETPPWFFRLLDDEYHFTLDAAARHENALCNFYYTIDGLWQKHTDYPRLIMRTDRGQQINGLTGSWKNKRVFCNPPYDSSLYKWVQKAATREAEIAVLLLPPSIDTRWFHDFIWNDLSADNEVRCEDLHFLKGRLRFSEGGITGPAPRAGNMVVIFGNDGKHACKEHLFILNG